MSPHQFLDRTFGKAEEINGRERCETYLFRWVIASGRDWKVYLHKFVGDDWSRDLHDHPKRFISMGIAGNYVEETEVDGRPNYRVYRSPWIRSFPATHKHRLMTPSGECWTLVIVLKTERDWGFWPGGRFMPWKAYVDGQDGAADRGKACD